MRLLILECSVDYTGRLSAHLPRAKRLLMQKNDGSVLIHSDSGSFKPLNWMNPPCTIVVRAALISKLTIGRGSPEGRLRCVKDPRFAASA